MAGYKGASHSNIWSFYIKIYFIIWRNLEKCFCENTRMNFGSSSAACWLSLGYSPLIFWCSKNYTSFLNVHAFLGLLQFSHRMFVHTWSIRLHQTKRISYTDFNLWIIRLWLFLWIFGYCFWSFEATITSLSPRNHKSDVRHCLWSSEFRTQRFGLKKTLRIGSCFMILNIY